MYKGNREMAICAESQGHLTIFEKGFLEKGQLDPGRYLLNSEEIRASREECQENSRVILVTPQLNISGPVTNGQVSTIFIAQGIVPSSIDVFLSKITMEPAEKIEEIVEGRKLEDDKIYRVGMARGLARLLDLGLGSNAVVFRSTVEGQMKALDLEVFQLFECQF